VQAGGGATWSGDSCSMGNVSVSRVIEAGVISSSKGGVEGDRMDTVRDVFDGGVAGIVAERGVTDGGVAVTGRGKRTISLSSSKSHSNSTSFCLRLVRFGGGDWNPGSGSGSWAGGGGEGVSGVETPPAAATGRDDCSGSSTAAVAKRSRLRRRRHLPAAVFNLAGAGRLQEKVRTCIPAL
jgi:hypothetical protein